MAIILQELLDRAEQAASGVAGAPAPQADREITAYVLYPHAVRAVYREQVRTGRHLENLSHPHPIEMLSGQGTIPDAVFREYLDRSYIPADQFSSFVPFEDYGRYRFNSQMKYYAARGSKFFYSGAVPIVLTTPAVAAAAASITITGSAAGAQVGDHFYLLDPTNGMVIDAYIATINGTTNFTLRGTTLVATVLTVPPVTGIIYNGQDDVILRSITDLVTNTASATVTSATAIFTSADKGRRLRAYETGTTTIVVDAIIGTVTNATDVILRAKPLSTKAAADAAVMYSPLLLQAVGIPALPTDICASLDISPEVAEDTIVKIASVLRGDIALETLIEVGRG